MKRCFKCGKTKPIGEFYRHPRMADGHLGKCKTCTRGDVKANYWERRDQYIAYERRRRPPKYGHRDIRPLPPAERMKRKRAVQAVSNALRDRRLFRQACAVCGAVDVEGHHKDYDRPLDVVWLCIEHHARQHVVVTGLD